MHIIKPVIDEINNLGLRLNTFILFSTDNGPAAPGIEATSQPGGMGMGSVGVTVSEMT